MMCATLFTNGSEKKITLCKEKEREKQNKYSQVLKSGNLGKG